MRRIKQVILILFVIFVASSVRLQAAKITKKSGSTLGRWQTLFRATNAVGTRQLPEKSPLKSLDEFTITGAYEKHVNRLNQVVCDGQWGISQGVLSQISGRAAAIKIGRAKEFELEAGIQAEGVGGWFILFGYDQGHGYGVYNVTMNQSGSPWFITEFRDGKGILDSDKELVRYECKGKETLKLRVVNEKVSLSIGNRKIMEDVELAGIHEGDIILGTYDTKYGPKPVKIYGIRLRTPK